MDYPHIESAAVLEDLDHDCSEHLELRLRNKGIGTAYATQCQFCGEFRGGEISKAKVKTQPPPSDQNLEDAFTQKRLEILSSRERTPSSLLHPRDSKTLEQKLAELGEVIDEFCSANEIGISTLLPIYLMRQRDRYINEGYSSRWQSEDELHDWFIRNFSKWFHIYHEVSGTGFVDREIEHIRIDFVIKAKDELIEHGFTDRYIGIEVKHLNPITGKGFHGKSSRGIFQALSYWYSGARWNLPNASSVELATVLIFSNLSFQDESEYVFNSLDWHYRKVWRSYLSIANHANVGELVVKIWNDNLASWAMEYNGAKYYSMHTGRGLVKGNPNVISKRRIGSTKR
ncbi:TPA: hypothetical protein L4A57_004705 [Pseudomonas aeruginosa]|uniref:hypothetical protein n=1 Tax=Pseudomonas aeruginosa TaxID=287 RepID=UPI00129869DB|nr:hypothetical protein [Pseudomonas aeruginosa]HBO0312669.1 hypothetical protein [Pseudomonas aeruginosa]